MQERVLSARRLVFTSEQISWECPEARWCEETMMETDTSWFRSVYPGAEQNSASLAVLAQECTKAKGLRPKAHSIWPTYAAMADLFSLLNFTNRGDRLDGFSGILQRITSITGHEFLWALPTMGFDLALLWEDADEVGMTRRKVKTTLPTSSGQRLHFPSWCWLGWNGFQTFDAAFQLKHPRGMPLLECYTYRNRRMEKIDDCEDGRAGSSTGPAAFDSPQDENSATPRRSTVHLEDVTTHLPSLSQALPKIPEGILLFSWASVSSLRLLRPPAPWSKITGKTAILNPEFSSEKVFGLKHEWDETTCHNIRNLYKIGKCSSLGDVAYEVSLGPAESDVEVQDATWDFIAVGREDVMANDHFFAVNRSEGYRRDGDWTLKVMRIGYRRSRHGGHRIATRLGLGEVNETAWWASKPRWELIALERLI